MAASLLRPSLFLGPAGHPPGNSPAPRRAADLMPSCCRAMVGRGPGSGRPIPAGPPLQKPVVSGAHGPRRSHPDPFAPKARRPAAAAMAARDAPESDAAELDAGVRGLWALRWTWVPAGPLRSDRSRPRAKLDRGAGAQAGTRLFPPGLSPPPRPSPSGAGAASPPAAPRGSAPVTLPLAPRPPLPRPLPLAPRPRNPYLASDPAPRVAPPPRPGRPVPGGLEGSGLG